MRLEDAIKRFRGKDDIFGIGNSESLEVMKALTLIREFGANSSLTIFGSKEAKYVKPEHRSVAISRLPIPREFWQENHIDYIAFTSDRGGETKPITTRKENPLVYQYIWLDKHQVDKLWPPPKRRIALKNPVHFIEPA